jgi:putrescine aminotransferase
MNHRPTAELVALNAAHHIQPFANGAVTKGVGSRVITRAEGVYLFDSEGKRILDGMAGLWCVNIGYGRTELADVAQRQMQQLPFYNTFFQTTHPPVVELATKIAEITPGDLNQTFFGNSGSDANDTNIRLVRHYWSCKGMPEKRTIISRTNAYHGSTVAATALGGMAHMHAQNGQMLPDFSFISQPFWWLDGGDMSPEEFGLKCAQELETEINRLGEDKVAAFIAEPVQGAGGVIVPPSTYWPEIQRICDAYDILLIADEVICGFGRTGEWFGSQKFNIRPDIMTIAKGLSSGYMPISGSVVSDRIANEFAEKGGDFFHGYTYSGHPVAAAVALENIRIMQEEKIVEHAAEMSPYFGARWAELGDHPLVGETRHCGMLAAFQMTPDASRRAPFAQAGAMGKIFKDLCVENGLMLRSIKDSIACSPPLVITKTEVDEIVASALKTLDQTHARAKAEGLMVAG